MSIIVNGIRVFHHYGEETVSKARHKSKDKKMTRRLSGTYFSPYMTNRRLQVLPLLTHLGIRVLYGHTDATLPRFFAYS